MMPDSKAIPHDIDAGSSSTFRYVVHGQRMQAGIQIKLIIIPDIVDDELEFSIETKPFWIFAKAM